MIRSNMKMFEEIIIKADAWCRTLDDFILANTFEDAKIKIYSYLPEANHKGKLGDLVIFEKKRWKFPKVVMIANKIADEWSLEFFQNGDWFNYFALQIG